MFENYGLFIYWDTGEECFVANSSEMMLCRGVGNTRQQALIVLEQDIESWLNVGRTLKLPRSKSELQETELLPVKEAEQNNVVAQPKITLPREEIITEIVVEGIRLSIRTDAKKPIIYLSGEAELRTIHGLKEAIAHLIASGTPKILIDVTEVTYMDSSSFGTLLSALGRLEKEHPKEAELVIAGANSQVLRMFQITRLNTVFTVSETAQDTEKLIAT